MFTVLKRIFFPNSKHRIVSDHADWAVQFPFALVEQTVTNAAAELKNIHPLVAGTVANIDELRQITMKVKDLRAELKLTVQLSAAQSALVYIEHATPKGGIVPEIEFLFPRSDRSTDNSKEYEFPLAAADPFSYQNNNPDPALVKIKIVIYPKLNSQNADIKYISQDIEAFRHELLKFNRKNNDFDTVSPAEIDFSAKTLILIHGTFSNTRHSYGDIFGTKSDWLSQLIDSKIYGQIIGFDHPTLIADARTNVDMLYRMLGCGTFEQPTDFMGTSQGGLLCQYIANDRRQDSPFATGRVGKAVLVNSANGVGYLSTAEGVARFFNVIRWGASLANMPVAADFAKLAHYSVESLILLPGLDLMKPGSARLLEILNQTPADSATRYYPVAADFDPQSVHAKLKERIAQWLDKIIKKMLGEYNDWVVGTKEQYRVPKDYCAIVGYDPAHFTAGMVSSIHGKSLAIKSVRDDIERFMR